MYGISQDLVILDAFMLCNLDDQRARRHLASEQRVLKFPPAAIGPQVRDGSRREIDEQEAGAAVLWIGGEYDFCRGELEFVHQPDGDGRREQRAGQMQRGAAGSAYESFMSHDAGLGDIEYRLEQRIQSPFCDQCSDFYCYRFVTVVRHVTRFSRKAHPSNHGSDIEVEFMRHGCETIRHDHL